MSNVSKLKQNIWKNYLFVFLTRFDLTQGTWMLYLSIKGMSLLQLGLLEGIFHITSFLMEVPTGAVADIWGRKVSRVCGRIFSVLGTLMLLASDNFYLFAFSFILWALSYNLESGAGEALVYDSLKEIGEENRYMKLAGFQEIILQLSSVGGLLIAGYLATKSYGYVYSFAAILGVFALAQAMTFTEPSIEMEINKREKLIVILKKQVIGSLKVIRDNKKIGFFILFSQGIAVFATSTFYYFQNYLKGNGFHEGQIGMILAISSLIAAIAASQTVRIEKIFKEKGILIIMPVVISICLWGVALSKYNYVFFIILNGVESIIYITMSDYLNKLLPSNKRATIISFSSMVFSFFMIIVFPIVGRIGDTFSLITAFKILAISGTIISLVNIYLISVSKNKSKLNKKTA